MYPSGKQLSPRVRNTIKFSREIFAKIHRTKNVASTLMLKFATSLTDNVRQTSPEAFRILMSFRCHGRHPNWNHKLQNPPPRVYLRKIRLIEVTAKCRRLNNWPVKELCGMSQNPIPPPPPHRLYTCKVTHKRKGGKGGRGESWTREKGIGATG